MISDSLVALLVIIECKILIMKSINELMKLVEKYFDFRIDHQRASKRVKRYVGKLAN